MALRDTISRSVRPFLAPGEELHAVVPGQTASPFVAGLGGALFFLSLNRYRIIAVTSRRILLLDAGKFTMKKAKAVVAELPRSTTLGPAQGMWHVVRINDEKLRVNRRFYKDIAAADAAGQPAGQQTPVGPSGG